MEAEKGKVMGIGYLFTKEELELLQKLFQGKKEKKWSEKEILSANSLEKKKLISGWQGSISVEPFLAAFVKLNNSATAIKYSNCFKFINTPSCNKINLL